MASDQILLNQLLCDLHCVIYLLVEFVSFVLPYLFNLKRFTLDFYVFETTKHFVVKQELQLLVHFFTLAQETVVKVTIFSWVNLTKLLRL